MDETYRLPLPTEGGDCLCPDCLRKAAGRAAAVDNRRAIRNK
jgi:hypothetical protein